MGCAAFISPLGYCCFLSGALAISAIAFAFADITTRLHISSLLRRHFEVSFITPLFHFDSLSFRFDS